jgi:pantoate--beta-alanine ligase
MVVIYKTAEMKARIVSHRNNGETTGFVPTMGALHQGHISLIQKSIRENKITVCSIFVNPTQFNDPKDLKNYPRTLEEDLKMLREAGCNIVFVPSEKEIYPIPDTRVFDFGDLDKSMEGKFRPGHFNGVAQVVSKFFDIILPDRAYFGEKDFQQLAIIKAMTKMQKFLTDIIPCPIVREEDGLAMSSRNKLLSPEQRKSAALISKTLFNALKNKDLPVTELKSKVIHSIHSDKNLKVEYFEIVDFDSLKPLNSWADSSRPIACIAVFAGQVRLIDNIRFF